MSGSVWDEGAARRELVEMGRRLDRRGLIAAADGNLSLLLCRSGPPAQWEILVTPSGAWKGRLAVEDLLVVDGEGAVLRGRGRPSSELPMHLAVYRTRTDVAAAVHAHPPMATAFAVARIPLEEHLLSEVVLRLGTIRTVAYRTPSTRALADLVAQASLDSDVLLLDNHGALTLGRDPWDALGRMETLEHFAQISYATRQLGGGVPLAPDEVAQLRALQDPADRVRRIVREVVARLRRPSHLD